MAKTGKKKNEWKRYLPVLLVAAGGAIVIFGQKWFENATDNFVAGIGTKFSNLRLKLIGLTTLRVTAIMTVTNTNPIGGKVNKFTGSLKYGANGQQIVPVNVGTFTLPANGTAKANVISEISLLQLGANAVAVVQSLSLIHI